MRSKVEAPTATAEGYKGRRLQRNDRARYNRPRCRGCVGARAALELRRRLARMGAVPAPIAGGERRGYVYALTDDREVNRTIALARALA